MRQEMGPETLEAYFEFLANTAVQFLCEDHTSFYFDRHKYAALIITLFSVAVLLYRSSEALSECSCSTSSSAAGYPSMACDCNTIYFQKGTRRGYNNVHIL